MSFCRIYAIFLRQLYLMRGSITRVIPIFVWIILDMVLWGFITRYLSSVQNSGFNFITSMLGAVLLWDFFSRVMQGVTTAFFEDIWSRNFLNIFATPISTTEYIGGLVLTCIATSLAGLLAMLALATGFFGLSFLSYGLPLIPLLLTLFVFGIALGIVGVAIVLRFGPAAEWLVWPLPAIIAPFVGNLYPMEVLPHWMQMIGYSLPLSYVFENIRAIAHGHVANGTTLISALALAAFYILLAGLFFNHIFKRAIKGGLIARYSAENVN